MRSWEHPISLCLFCKNPVIHRVTPTEFKLIQTPNGERTDPYMLTTMHRSCMHRHRALKNMRKKFEARMAKLPPRKIKPKNVFYVECDQCEVKLAISKGAKNINVSALSEGLRIIEHNPLRIVWWCRNRKACELRQQRALREKLGLRQKEENVLYLPHKIAPVASRNT